MKLETKRSLRAVRGTTTGLAILFTICFASPSSFANLILANDPNDPTVILGTAGNFAVLGVGNSLGISAPIVTNNGATINGNEGIGFNGRIDNLVPSVINGNVVQFAPGQVFGAGTITGSVTTDPTTMNQAFIDAIVASSAAAGLAPTQTFTLTGTPLTITGNGGINVIQLNGNITNSITLVGTPTDFFVLNVNGGLTLTGSQALSVVGVPVQNVLYNFTSAGLNLTSQLSNTVQGTLLANNNSFIGFANANGAIISGRTITLTPGAVINQDSFIGFSEEPPPPPPPVPEPSSLSMLGGGIAVFFGLLHRRVRRRN